jgi:hypothetical protein
MSRRLKSFGPRPSAARHPVITNRGRKVMRKLEASGAARMLRALSLALRRISLTVAAHSTIPFTRDGIRVVFLRPLIGDAVRAVLPELLRLRVSAGT